MKKKKKPEMEIYLNGNSVLRGCGLSIADFSNDRTARLVGEIFAY